MGYRGDGREGLAGEVGSGSVWKQRDGHFGTPSAKRGTGLWWRENSRSGKSPRGLRKCCPWGATGRELGGGSIPGGRMSLPEFFSVVKIGKGVYILPTGNSEINCDPFRTEY